MTEYSKLEKSLKYWGALPEKAVMRLLGDHEFYYKMLKSFLASRVRPGAADECDFPCR